MLGPGHAGSFHANFDEVPAGAFDRVAGDRSAVGEVFVIPHAGAVTIEVIGDRVQEFCVWDLSCRLRDTVAVRLLRKGVSLEDISKLPGHASVAVTKKCYAPWVA